MNHSRGSRCAWLAKCLSLVAAAQGLLLASASCQEIGELPSEPQALLQWVAQHWTDAEWNSPAGKDYMRPQDDTAWKARMLAMQQLVRAGDQALPALTQALESDNTELQIFAAQTLGYLPRQAPADGLSQQLKNHPSAAVRLYAADALGMKGGTESHALFQQQLASEPNGDVKKHLRYALERDGAAVAPSVIDTLTGWEPDTIDSAEIGKPAPGFELEALNGKTVRLEDFLGKSAVVLVFIYGDT